MSNNDNSSRFSKLAEALRQMKVPEETIAAGIEYLDISKPADSRILKRLPPFSDVKWSGIIVGSFSIILEKAVFGNNDKEYSRRWANFALAAAGADCDQLLWDNYDYASLKEALSLSMGEKAEAAAYFCIISLVNSPFYFKSRYKTVKPSPEICIQTLEMFSEEYLKNHPMRVTIPCLYALDGNPLPADKKKISGTAKKACEILSGLWDHQMRSDDLVFFLAAEAEAAHFSEEHKQYFGKNINQFARNVSGCAACLPVELPRILDVIDEFPDSITPDHLEFLCGEHSGDNSARLEALAKKYPEMIRNALEKFESAKKAVMLEEILAKTGEKPQEGYVPLKTREQKKIADHISSSLFDGSRAQEQTEVYDFIMNGGDVNKLVPMLKQTRLKYSSTGNDYFDAYGADEFFSRALTAVMLCEQCYGRFHRIREYTGFSLEDHEEETVGYLLNGGADMQQILTMMSYCLADLYEGKASFIERTAAGIAEYPDKLSEVNTDDLDAGGREMTVRAYGICGEKFKDELFKAAADSSKAVREALTDIISSHEDWRDDIIKLLDARKSSARELAVSIISKQGAEKYSDVLKKAFDKEKSEKIRSQIAAAANLASPEDESAQSTDEIIAKLTKGNKSSKLAWLYETPFKEVRKKDSSAASEDHLRAVLLCYANMEKFGRSGTADALTEELNEKDLEAFAMEVFGKWTDKGAQAKQKWILYFCAIHGGSRMVSTFMQLIKEWAENSRGAIAAEAVRAMAMNGSNEALMNVDSMARKFKNKQVRGAAVQAMSDAAEQLGLTTEELADKIVPDLGFGEDLSRSFDYGNRQFRVYISPSLGLEIFCGEKKIKNLPKPAASDEKEKAEAAYDDFKEMKKQLKNIINVQKQRLEYVLMCDRKWTSASWKDLFVKNAVMHSFAAGLIWGIYQNGKLSSTFRYMEDGSFSDIEGDEFSLPENASIGLVHPLELSENDISAWTEQLSDYEIVQPFPQLARPVFTPEKSENELPVLKRFTGTEVNSISLMGKMQKLGWYKGEAEDAGCFYYFYREDISRRIKNPDGTYSAEGTGAMLTFSGMYIAVYDNEGEAVTLEDLIFFEPGNIPNYWDNKKAGCIPAGKINPRYFSEIMLQLSAFSEE